MNYIITSTNYTSEILRYQTLDNVRIISNDELHHSTIEFGENDKVYIFSESSLEQVQIRTSSEKKRYIIKMLKDKFEFRKLLSGMFPDFYFNRLNIDELTLHRLPDRKLIIKPQKGYFATAIEIYNPGDDITSIAHRLKSDLEKKSAFFPESVLSRTEVVIEEFIEGNELAVDMFYNDNGEPVIVNIYAHPFPKNNQYFHVLYYTNKKVFDQFYHPLIDFFRLLKKSCFNVESFPIHAEFKYNNDKLIPIEMNPLRFGGDGLADLTYYSFGFNPFEAYFKNYEFDFDSFWEKNDDDHYGWIFAYNGTEIDVHKRFPNYQKLKDHIGDYLHFVEMDHTKNPVFAIAYVQKQDFTELEKMLKTEFNEFFH